METIDLINAIRKRIEALTLATDNSCYEDDPELYKERADLLTDFGTTLKIIKIVLKKERI